MNILVAGGSGLVGQALVNQLNSNGHNVYVLTRQPAKANEIKWDTSTGIIEPHEILGSIGVIVNLSGQGINDKRWTKKRKKELEDSRIGTNQLLFDEIDLFPNLKHFVSASGVTAYPFDDGSHLWVEKEAYGNSYIAQLVKSWEASADLFKKYVPVTKLRIAVVLSERGGALPQLVSLTNKNLGAALSTGKQQMPWVHLDDLVNQFVWVIEQNIKGTFNTNAGNVSNGDLMAKLRKIYGKSFNPPNVPSFMISLLFGERGDLLLKGNRASNQAIKQAGFTFKYESLTNALTATKIV